ncbi:MAG TPA: tRNA pseudouridine(38-40) synthase TruA [Actinobacteria bacterium]|nr:tRNA pseudouridine(38-40) synthase TruA [Actinomycetota bacterium]
MRNIKLILQYNGKNYYGFQRQPNKPTIQGEVEKALSTLLRERISIIGSGRTDAGVHAFRQVANFRTNSDTSVYRLKWSVNALLPSDIVVIEACEVGDNFDSRRDAISREYHYFILNRGYPTVFVPDFCYFLARSLNFALMQEAADKFLGVHNFSSFCVRKGWKDESYVKTVYEVKCSKDEHGLIKIGIKADSFLHHMVRCMVGALIQVGLGNLEIEEIPKILERKKRVGYLAPSQGLILMNVQYP